MKKIISVGSVLIIAFGLVVSSFPGAPVALAHFTPPQPPPPPTICHVGNGDTPPPWEGIHPDLNAVLINGHGDHDGDIIPSFTYQVWEQTGTTPESFTHTVHNDQNKTGVSIDFQTYSGDSNRRVVLTAAAGYTIDFVGIDYTGSDANEVTYTNQASPFTYTAANDVDIDNVTVTVTHQVPVYGNVEHTYPGKNLTTVYGGATGEQILANECVIPVTYEFDTRMAYSCSGAIRQGQYRASNEQDWHEFIVATHTWTLPYEIETWPAANYTITEIDGNPAPFGSHAFSFGDFTEPAECLQTPPQENTQQLCSDQIDNDSDTLIDLADPDCAAFLPPPVENTQELCSDQIDNDSDTLIDLADPDCAAFLPPPTSEYPTYTSEQNSCPQGTVAELVGTYDVGSQDADGVSFGTTLNSYYVFEASNTFRPSGGNNWRADAGFSTNSYAEGQDWTLATQYGIYGTPPDKGAHALLADLGLGVGILDWGAFTNTHIYTKAFQIPTTTVQFLIGDRYGAWYETPWQNQSGMNDNEGSLQLKAYECVPDVPPPTPPVTCPAGTTQSSLPLETVTVNSASSVATPSVNALSNGQSYLLVSSGAWVNSLNVADTEYTSVDNWTTYANGYDITPYFLGEGEFDLQVDNTFVDWGSYNSTHQYSYLYAGTGVPVNLLMFDGDSNPVPPVLHPEWYGDNSGNLTVDIYSCDSPPPQCDENVEQTIVSDASTQYNGGDSTVLDGTMVGAGILPPGGVWADISGASWIWGTNGSQDDTTVPKTEVFTRSFTISGAPTSASLDLSTDNGYVVKVNGSTVADQNVDPTDEYSYRNVHTYDITSYVTTGINTLEITVTNFGRSGTTFSNNPGGLIYKVTTNSNECAPLQDDPQDPTAYTLTYTAGDHGSITGTSPQTVNSGGDGTAVTAEPASGYHFVNWSDASTANPRTDTNVTGNISVTANFAVDETPTTGTLNVVLTVSGGPKDPADFTVEVLAGHPSPSTFPGNSAGTAVTIDANEAYNVNVSPLANYTMGTSGNCNDVSGVTPGGSVTCTVTETFALPGPLFNEFMSYVISGNGCSGPGCGGGGGGQVLGASTTNPEWLQEQIRLAHLQFLSLLQQFLQSLLPGGH